MPSDPRPICPVGAMLGEGPVWAGDALWFVDIKARRIHRFDPDGGALRGWDAPEQVGWVLPYVAGGFVAGLQSGLFHFDPDTGSFGRLATVEPDRPGNRLNDACTDPAGRLWFGTMDDREQAASGLVYRADERGIAAVAHGISIVNGPAVSPDGGTLYHVDSIAGLIHASRVQADGTLADTRALVRVDVAAHGYPDGPTVDAEGCLWVGMYGGWAVHRYSPAGELIARVRLPVRNVTKIAFGGPGLRTAYATTARKDLSTADLDGQPLAGHVFAFDPGVAGLATAAVQPFAANLV